ncbi:MAG: FkbM family methyltransferase [Saprospirales bacterium]|nr:MAG: FkbM family methyltransferase [Saprospirales bacterium]
MKSIIRQALMKVPLNINKNITYDRQTVKVLQKSTRADSNCIDVGCHKGEFLDSVLKTCPDGKHFAFEPLPALFDDLKQKYGQSATVTDICLSDTSGETTFQYVKSNPAYSGILRRKYDRSSEKVEPIKVQTDTLDRILPEDHPVDFIKMDVEGAEYRVLTGARKTIEKYRPVIVFEFGLGAADIYGVTPTMMYKLLHGELNMKIGLMRDYLKGRQPMNEQTFKKHFYQRLDFYFMAWP